MTKKPQTAVGGGPAWEGIFGWRQEVQHCNTQVISPWPRVTVHSSCSRRFPASNGCHSAMPSAPWHCQRLSTRQLIGIPEKVRVQHVSTQLKQVNSCQMISRTGCYFLKKKQSCEMYYVMFHNVVMLQYFHIQLSMFNLVKFVLISCYHSRKREKYIFSQQFSCFALSGFHTHDCK